LSEAWLAESTARVCPVYPRAARVPMAPSVQAVAVVVLDGKAIKRVAKRLKPLRGRHGGVLGGKALVAVELANGLAVAMATDADGETNEAKLVPALLPQVRRRVAGPRLWVADSQFCDLTQTAAFTAAQDHFVVRYHPKTHFCPDPTRPAQYGQDAQGRAWVEDWGWLGCARAKMRRVVPRITLSRPGEESVVVITDLLDAEQYPAAELLMVYLARWSIERVFQQITEVFHLQALIGTTPQGTVFQLAFCLLLYNLLQVVRAYVAVAQARPPATISTELLFADVQRQLVALTELVPSPVVVPLFEPASSPDTLCAHLRRLLATVWTPPAVGESAGEETHTPDPAPGDPGQSDLGLSALGRVPSAATNSDTTSALTFTAVASRLSSIVGPSRRPRAVVASRACRVAVVASVWARSATLLAVSATFCASPCPAWESVSCAEVQAFPRDCPQDDSLPLPALR
jgi:Transposase DDE domain